MLRSSDNLPELFDTSKFAPFDGLYLSHYDAMAKVNFLRISHLELNFLLTINIKKNYSRQMLDFSHRWLKSLEKKPTITTTVCRE